MLLDLDADAGTGVTDANTNRLDGEWTNPADSPSTPGGLDAFPSGNGTAGGDFRFRLNVLPADVSRGGGGTVNAGDVTQVRNRQFTNTSTPGPPPNLYSVFHDVNGNGVINAQDVTLTRNRQFTALPTGQPALTAAPLRTARAPLTLSASRATDLVDVPEKDWQQARTTDLG